MVKPAVVLPKESTVATVLMSVLPNIRKEVLAAGMLEMACNGFASEVTGAGEERILENDELLRFGNRVLSNREGK